MAACSLSDAKIFLCVRRYVSEYELYRLSIASVKYRSVYLRSMRWTRRVRGGGEDQDGEDPIERSQRGTRSATILAAMSLLTRKRGCPRSTSTSSERGVVGGVNKTSLAERIDILCLGADFREGTKEADVLDTFWPMALSLSQRTMSTSTDVVVRVLLIGPNIPKCKTGTCRRSGRVGNGRDEAARDIDRIVELRVDSAHGLFHEVWREIEKEKERGTCATSGGDGCDMLRDIQLRCQDFSKEICRSSRAILACAFDAGIWGYDSWIPTIRLVCATLKIPLVVTSYNALEAEDDADILRDIEGTKVLWESVPNPHGSLVEWRSVYAGEVQSDNAMWHCLIPDSACNEGALD